MKSLRTSLKKIKNRNDLLIFKYQSKSIDHRLLPAAVAPGQFARNGGGITHSPTSSIRTACRCLSTHTGHTPAQISVIGSRHGIAYHSQCDTPDYFIGWPCVGRKHSAARGERDEKTDRNKTAFHRLIERNHILDSFHIVLQSVNILAANNQQRV